MKKIGTSGRTVAQVLLQLWKIIFIHYSLEGTSTPNIKALRTGQVQTRIHESQQLVQQTLAFNQ